MATPNENLGPSKLSPHASLDEVLRGHAASVTSSAFHPNFLEETDGISARDANDAECCDNGESDERKYSSRREGYKQMSSASSDGSVIIYNIQSSRTDNGRIRAYRYLGHRGPVHRLAYSPSGKVLASCSSDNTVRLWYPSRNCSRGESTVLKGHGGPVRCVDFTSPLSGSLVSSRTGNETDSLLLTGSDDKIIKMWSLPETSTPSNAHFVTSFVASGGDDKTVRIWSCERAVNLATYSWVGSRAFGINSGGVRDLSFLPSGMSLASCGTDGFTRLFDLRSDSVVRTLDCNAPSSTKLSTVDSVSVHLDGFRLLCSTSDSARDSRVLMFDLRSPSEPLFEIPSINSIGAGKKGRMKTRPSSAGSRRRCPATSIPTSVTFSSDGSRFATSLKDNAVRLYKLNATLSSAPADTPAGIEQSPPSKPRIGRDSNLRKQVEIDQRQMRESVTVDVARDQHEAEVQGGNTVSSNLDSVSEPPRINGDNCSVGPTFTSPNSSWKYHKDDLPEILASTLDRMVCQIDLLARTVKLLEQRLAIQESAMDRMQKDLGRNQECSDTIRVHDVESEQSLSLEQANPNSCQCAIPHEPPVHASSLVDDDDEEIVEQKVKNILENIHCP